LDYGKEYLGTFGFLNNPAPKNEPKARTAKGKSKVDQQVLAANYIQDLLKQQAL